MDVLFTAVCFFARLGVFIGCLLLLGGIEALSELHRRFLFCCLFAVLPPRHFFCCGWLFFKLQTHIPAANHRMVDSPPHLERERERERHAQVMVSKLMWPGCGKTAARIGGVSGSAWLVVLASGTWVLCLIWQGLLLVLLPLLCFNCSARPSSCSALLCPALLGFALRCSALRCSPLPSKSAGLPGRAFVLICSVQ